MESSFVIPPSQGRDSARVNVFVFLSFMFLALEVQFHGHMLIRTMVSQENQNYDSGQGLLAVDVENTSSRSTPFNWKMIVVKGHQDAAKHARKFPSNYITQ